MKVNSNETVTAERKEFKLPRMHYIMPPRFEGMKLAAVKEITNDNWKGMMAYTVNLIMSRT